MKNYPEVSFPFSSFLERAFDMPFSRELQLMKTDIHSENGEVLMEIEVPGFTKEEISVQVKEGFLQIKAEHHEEAKAEKPYTHQERYYGKMERSYYIGRQVNPKDVKAQLQNGVLTLRYPEKKEPESSKILID